MAHDQESTVTKKFNDYIFVLGSSWDTVCR